MAVVRREAVLNGSRRLNDQPPRATVRRLNVSKKIRAGVIIAIIALAVCFVPLKEVAYTATVDYEDTETYTETEPLSYEVIAFVKKEQQDPRFISGSVAFSKDPEEVAKALQEVYKQIPVGYVLVQNTDVVSGTFAVRITFYTPGEQDTKDVTLQLRPEELGEAKFYATSINADKDEWSWEYKVTPDTKKVTKERTVLKQRCETRYKKVSLLEYLLHY